MIDKLTAVGLAVALMVAMTGAVVAATDASSGESAAVLYEYSQGGSSEDMIVSAGKACAVGAIAGGAAGSYFGPGPGTLGGVGAGCAIGV